MPETRMDIGSLEFSMLLKIVMMFGWQIQPSESGGCGMHIKPTAEPIHPEEPPIKM